MKIVEIPPGKTYPSERLNTPRCARKVKSTGTGYFDTNQDRCSRLARFQVDGVNLCTQHAGEAALKYLIDQQQPNALLNIKEGDTLELVQPHPFYLVGRRFFA